MTDYFRPIICQDYAIPKQAHPLNGRGLWFDKVQVLSRDRAPELIKASELPDDIKGRLINSRPDFCEISMGSPSIMGILNVTPDSFSDGGDHADPVSTAAQMIKHGADIIDIGGESTRPGAAFVDTTVEISRTAPILKALSEKGLGPLSIDTRKAPVALAAITAGAVLFNDVTALSFDKNSLQTAADSNASVCLMHAQGAPGTMQDAPVYDNVLLDVYDYLERRIQACIRAGIPAENIMIDPGIGFGKTDAHNLALMRGLALLHGLGCPILLGVSRKSIIGRIGNAPDPKQRFAGSIALGLAGLSQGVQMLRVHDIAETKQAINLWQAIKKV